MKKHLKYILLALAIVVALGVVFYKNLDYSYEMQGEAENILDSAYVGATGYDVAGHVFTVNGEDPQFYLAGMSQQIGGIELVLANPSAEIQPIPVQVFYAKEGENYSEKHSIKTSIQQGNTTCQLPIPLAQYTNLRFDIDGNFTLSEIRAYTAETKITPVISNKTIKNCMMYFPAVILGFILIFWAHSVRAEGMDAKSYMKNIFFGAETKTDRQVHLDYLRILAAVLVILAHACSPMVDLADTDWKRLLLVCGLSIGLCCNLIYVMLSGTLLLTSKKEEKTLLITENSDGTFSVGIK